MRGKVGDHAVIGVHHRSTPAHAGKSHCSRRRATALRDHPRACGEKPRVSSPIGRQMGSPPRMRGKGEVEAGKESVDRITPAYAGKRGRCPRPAGRRWDHPRVCGEKIRARLHPRFLVGSPPRMRGKERKRCCTATGTGITPAYAGKSRLHTSVLPWRRDHPRICGEKLRVCPALKNPVGSPPRMRGKAFGSAAFLFARRITPAYAGKRLKRSRSTVPPVAIVPLFPSVCNKPVVSDGSPAGRDAPLFLPAENAVPASPAYNLRSL